MAKLSEDMHNLDGEVQEIVILAPETGKPIAADDHDRRFFEAAWMHKRKGGMLRPGRLMSCSQGMCF